VVENVRHIVDVARIENARVLRSGSVVRVEVARLPVIFEHPAEVEDGEPLA
jgi:hypothetical protein